MALRFDGALKKWNAERGFGFIVADQGGQELFVHISAFPRDGRVPAVGEPLSFEIEPDHDGRKRAVRVRRPGAAQPSPAYTTQPRLSRAPKAHHTSGFGSRVIGLIMVAALGWYGYTHYANRVAQIKAAPQRVFEAPAPGGFQCDGRKHCSQMTSCKEARLFLKNCPGVEMDGNHDGVPCEQQWCTSLFAN